jgi:hypothetical protein
LDQQRLVELIDRWLIVQTNGLRLDPRQTINCSMVSLTAANAALTILDTRKLTGLPGGYISSDFPGVCPKAILRPFSDTKHLEQYL